MGKIKIDTIMNCYPVLPHIGYGILKEGGFYMTLPFAAIRDDDIFKMHDNEIKKIQGQYKSIIDVIMVTCLNKLYLDEFTNNGVIINKKSLFNGAVNIKWIITFKCGYIHNVSGYTQKILLDTIINTKILINDTKDCIKNKHTILGYKNIDSITCIIFGNIRKQLFFKNTPIVEYKKLLASFNNIKNSDIIIGDDDGEY